MSRVRWVGPRLNTVAVGVLCSLLFSAAAVAGDGGGLPRPVFDKLNRYGIPLDGVSVVVSAVEDGRELLSVNERVPRNPASVIKLLTALAGLDNLGAEYTWATEAYIDGALSAGRLDGNLVIKGYGDPLLAPESLWAFARGLRERGLKEINGDIVLDNSFFEEPDSKPGDFDGEPHRVYNALPRALSLGLQATRLHLYPDSGARQVRVFSDPPLTNLNISNGLELVDAPCRSRYHRPSLTIEQGRLGATVKVGGKFASQCPESSYARLVMDPEAHFGGAFSALWQELGGRLTGRVVAGVGSPDAVLFHTMESRPLGEVIRAMNKYSSNLMSRLLFLTVAAEQFGAPGSVENGRRAVVEWLVKRGIDMPELVLDNGSGLSRDTRVSARSLARLLAAAYHSPHMPEFMASLAVSGVDGTMRKRFAGEPLEGRAHIKTGSLNHVSAMAGYVLDRYGRRRVVIALINHEGVLAWQGKQVQDSLLQWVFDGGAGLAVQTADGSGECAPATNAPLATQWRLDPIAEGRGRRLAPGS